MLLVPESIITLEKGFSLLFEKAYNADAIPVTWDQKAERVDTPGIEINVYGWIAEMPRFRKWIGARLAKRLAARTHQIRNEPYEFSYAIGRDDIKYDRFGMFSGHFTRAGVAARLWYDQMLSAVQLVGHTTKCYDGQFFYDTDHPRDPDDPGSPTFPNLFTARLPTPENIAYVYGQMAATKDADGQPLKAVPNVIEFGPGLRDKVMAALNADIIAQVIRNQANNDNVAAASVTNNLKSLAGLITPLLNDELPDTVWFMHHTKIMKPFIVQVETPPSGLESRVNLEDPHVWDNNEFLFGSRATGGAGYGLPHLSARVETT